MFRLKLLKLRLTLPPYVLAVWRKERETESVSAFIAACGKPAKID
jgi:hypothetical protein